MPTFGEKKNYFVFYGKVAAHWQARWDPALSVAAQAPLDPPCATASGPWVRMLATAAARLPRCDVRVCGKGDFLGSEL